MTAIQAFAFLGSVVVFHAVVSLLAEDPQWKDNLSVKFFTATFVLTVIWLLCFVIKFLSL